MQKRPDADVRYMNLLWMTAQSFSADGVCMQRLVKWAIKRLGEQDGPYCKFGARDLLQIKQYTQSASRRKFRVSAKRGTNLSRSLVQQRLGQYFDSIDPRNKIPKYKAEVKCDKCGLDKFITPLAIQTRRADEMQAMQYKCSNHKPPHIWKI